MAGTFGPMGGGSGVGGGIVTAQDTWANIAALPSPSAGDNYLLTNATGAPARAGGAAAQVGDVVTYTGTTWLNLGPGAAQGPKGDKGDPGDDAVLDDTLGAIAATTDTGLIERLSNGLVSLRAVTDFGRSMIAAANAAAGRALLGLGSIATQNANALGALNVTVTTPSTNTTTGALTVAGGLGVAGTINAGGVTTTDLRLGGSGLTGAILKQSRLLELEGKTSNAIGLPANRLLNAGAIYDISSNNLSEPQLAQLFDSIYDTNVDFPVGTTTITVDFRGGVGLGAGTGFLYGQGLHLLYPVDGWGTTSTFGIEYQIGGSWVFGPLSTIVARKLCVLNDTAFRSVVHALRFTVVNNGTSPATARVIESYPSDISTAQGLFQLGHTEQFDCVITRATNRQFLYGPGLVVADKAGNRAEIGNGRIRANDLPNYASDAAAAADSGIPSGTFYTLTGDTAVRRKP